MSLPETIGGYALNRDEGEALFFGGGIALVKATAAQTEGRYAAIELRMRQGGGPPLHIHRNEDEFFLVLAGEVRLRHADAVVEAGPGSLVYGPRGVPHQFKVDSEEARLLLLFGPAGVEEFFREVGRPAPSVEMPPPGGPPPDIEVMKEIAARHGQDFIGPPLPSKE